MLYAVFSRLDMRAEGDRLIVSLGQDSSLARDMTATGDLKKAASAFFGREMTVEFVEQSGTRADTIDDYMREAETLFRT